MGCSEPGTPRLAIYLPRMTATKVVRLQLANDSELEEWISHLTSGLNNFNCQDSYHLDC